MPRSAANRQFGFKAPGLVRILTAADIDEVRLALQELAIEPDRSGVATAVRNLLRAPFALLEALLNTTLGSVIPLSEGLKAKRTKLDEVINGLARLASHGDMRTHHAQELRRLIGPLRTMRAQFTGEILRSKELPGEIRRFKTEKESLERSQETSLKAILDSPDVVT